MPWTPNEKEVAAVFAADGKHRYDYFVERARATGRVSALYQDGWASLGDDQQKLIPIWPHAAFAAAFAQGDWHGFVPQEIALDVFLERWIPGLRSEGIEPAIFPNLSGQAMLVSLEQLEASLRDEPPEPAEVEE